ncbi:uracil-DNA glycosylase [Chitinimonas sp.]|uniref:uracil-DNA glycosylase n=1 Tax=Chitinimonas sp. TaxID=1934313 RepID=UPI0035B15AA1
MSLPDCWAALLADQLEQPYWHALQSYLQTREQEGAEILPPFAQRFAALAATAPEQVKVVILGQDPYHGPGQAHGLSFSVPAGVRPPPSLQNIFKEIARDLGYNPPQCGDLSGWAKQGVLLLNSVLTVEAGRAGSHRKRGWENLTDALVARLSADFSGIVFMLWGAYAEEKAPLIDAGRHLLLLSPHPSPLSAYRGFIGNGHFSAANRYLQQQGRQPIDWAAFG